MASHLRCQVFYFFIFCVILVSSQLQSTTKAPAANKSDDEINNSNKTLPSYILDNSTLKDHNIKGVDEDHHSYYNSSLITDEKISKSLWVDLENRSDVKIHETLSKSHRKAGTIRLSFDFPYYGHLVRNITIATGGFLYTGDFIHSWLAATQYIAPLMANFDTRISNDSFIKYVDNGTSLTVLWEKVFLKDRLTANFTFQVTLHSTGDIIFVYKHIPFLIESVADSAHPLKIGISDAYVLDRSVFYIRRKTIYEYHRIFFGNQEVGNWSALYLSALPTCLHLKDCTSCLSQKIGFQCNWCQKANRCSSGVDRFLQDWLTNQCQIVNYTSANQCMATSTVLNVPTTPLTTPTPAEHSEEEPTYNSSVGSVVMIVITIFLFILFISWFAYAYSYPHTASGQFLIRYRLSQWRWRRGEARYTAATIHM